VVYSFHVVGVKFVSDFVQNPMIMSAFTVATASVIHACNCFSLAGKDVTKLCL